MKYQNINAFEKHLEQAIKLPLSRVFLVVSSCAYERGKIADKIVAAISQQAAQAQFLCRDAGEGSIKLPLEELNTLSLFSGEKILYLNNIDKLKKLDLSVLTTYIEKPSESAYLVLGAGSSKGLSELYAKGKKELIACDLSEEKPWEYKNRLKKMLADQAFRAKKRISMESIDALMDLIGPSLPHLEQELDKLITYAMQSPEITLADVRLLCSAQRIPPLYEWVDQIIWGSSPFKITSSVDLSLVLPLLSQIRTQLQHGLMIASLIARGVALHEMSSYLPALKPAALDKLLSRARIKPLRFFKNALDLLFETELMAKNSSIDLESILDLFLSKLHSIKKACRE